MSESDLQFVRASYVAGDTRINRLRSANGLVRAQKHADGLKTELPLVSRNYRNIPRVLKRMDHASEAIKDGAYTAEVILRGKKVFGMLSAQMLQPSPVKLVAPSVEISYWHATPSSTDEAIAIGSHILERLMDTKTTLPPSAESIWMVTRPDDVVKGAVLGEAGFMQMEEPRLFDISDGVDMPRQLWSRRV